MSYGRFRKGKKAAKAGKNNTLAFRYFAWERWKALDKRRKVKFAMAGISVATTAQRLAVINSYRGMTFSERSKAFVKAVIDGAESVSKIFSA